MSIAGHVSRAMLNTGFRLEEAAAHEAPRIGNDINDAAIFDVRQRRELVTIRPEMSAQEAAIFFGF